jgi:hypothetical protein
MAIADGTLTLNVLSSGTPSRSVSYIFLFWKAFLKTIRRNVWRSIAHNRPSVTAWKYMDLFVIKCFEFLSRVLLLSVALSF